MCGHQGESDLQLRCGLVEGLVDDVAKIAQPPGRVRASLINPVLPGSSALPAYRCEAQYLVAYARIFQFITQNEQSRGQFLRGAIVTQRTGLIHKKRQMQTARGMNAKIIQAAGIGAPPLFRMF